MLTVSIFAHCRLPFVYPGAVELVALARATRGGCLQEKRSHDRHAIQLDIVMVRAGERYPGQTRDLSLGGMFVHTKAPLRFAMEVELHLSLPALKYEGQVPAIVRWIHGDGVGLAFRSLRARDVHALNQLFKQAGLGVG